MVALVVVVVEGLVGIVVGIESIVSGEDTAVVIANLAEMVNSQKQSVVVDIDLYYKVLIADVLHVYVVDWGVVSLPVTSKGCLAGAERAERSVEELPGMHQQIVGHHCWSKIDVEDAASVDQV